MVHNLIIDTVIFDFKHGRFYVNAGSVKKKLYNIKQTNVMYVSLTHQ
jgi:hypothetical protein